jgi:hypothetical protein
MKQHDENEPLFISEEVEAGYEFEQPPIACTGNLCGVLERMSDAELALQRGEITDQERKHRQNKPFSAN